MLIKELIGKRISNFYATFGSEQEWLDTADCIIELEDKLLIGFPYGFNGEEVWIRDYDPNAEDLLKNTSQLRGLKIINFFWYDDESEKGFFLLENGSLITETTMSPKGTGLAGINYYKSLEEILGFKGNDIKQLLPT